MNAKELIQEAITHPKTVAGASVASSAANATISESWNFTDPNFIAAIVGIIAAAIGVYFAWRRDKREQMEHELRMSQQNQNFTDSPYKD